MNSPSSNAWTSFGFNSARRYFQLACVALLTAVVNGFLVLTIGARMGFKTGPWQVLEDPEFLRFWLLIVGAGALAGFTLCLLLLWRVRLPCVVPVLLLVTGLASTVTACFFWPAGPFAGLLAGLAVMLQARRVPEWRA